MSKFPLYPENTVVRAIAVAGRPLREHFARGPVIRGQRAQAPAAH